MEAENVHEQMASLAQEFDACRSAFTAMGDENRQRILMVLLEHHGGMRVGEITAHTNLSRPAVSHHLKILKDAGIVNMFKQGTKHFYHVDANEGQWEQIAALVSHIYGLVKEVSAKRQAGEGCCNNIR